MRFGLTAGSLPALGFAVVCVVVAMAARILVNVVRPDILAHATYYPAVLIATLIGGAWAGMLALALGGVASWWTLEASNYGFGETTPSRVVDLALYVASSMVIVWAAEEYRRVVRRLDEEERFRRKVVEELDHRVRNKFAIVHAILRYELKNHKELWDIVDGRLRALAATDAFVTRSDGQTAGISDILTAEFVPYDPGRVSLEGEPVELPSQLAVMVALIFHELATNAAKYGALSTLEGRVAVSWAKEGEKITIDWRESGGPPVPAPSRKGLGKRLLEHGLDQFHGRIESRFESTGFGCAITFTLPGEQPPPPPSF